MAEAAEEGNIELAPTTCGSFGGWLTTDVTPVFFLWVYSLATIPALRTALVVRVANP
jgi:hypothetical protein